MARVVNKITNIVFEARSRHIRFLSVIHLLLAQYSLLMNIEYRARSDEGRGDVLCRPSRPLCFLRDLLFKKIAAYKDFNR